MGWLSTIGQVAGIVAQVLGTLDFDAPPPPPPGPSGSSSSSVKKYYRQGDIVWYMQNGNIYAFNPTGEAHGISYALSKLTDTGQPVNTSLYIPLDPETRYQATEDISTFADGQFSLNKTMPTVQGASVSPITAAVAFGIKALAIGVAVAVIGGVELSVTGTAATGWKVKLSSTGPRLLSANVTVTDQTGTSVTANAAFTPPAPPHSGAAANPENSITENEEIALPSGINLSPTVADLNLSLEIERASYMAATQEGRKKLMRVDTADIKTFADLSSYAQLLRSTNQEQEARQVEGQALAVLNKITTS